MLVQLRIVAALVLFPREKLEQCASQSSEDGGGKQASSKEPRAATAEKRANRFCKRVTAATCPGKQAGLRERASASGFEPVCVAALRGTIADVAQWTVSKSLTRLQTRASLLYRSPPSNLSALAAMPKARLVIADAVAPEERESPPTGPPHAPSSAAERAGEAAGGPSSLRSMRTLEVEVEAWVAVARPPKIWPRRARS